MLFLVWRQLSQLFSQVRSYSIGGWVWYWHFFSLYRGGILFGVGLECMVPLYHFLKLLSIGFILTGIAETTPGGLRPGGIISRIGTMFLYPLYVSFLLLSALFCCFCGFTDDDVFILSWRGFLFLALAAIIVSVPISQFAIRQTGNFFLTG